MPKLVNFRPIFVLAIVFILSIILTYLTLYLGALILFIPFALILVACLIFCFLTKRANSCVFAIILTLTFCIGATVSGFKIANFKNAFKFDDGSTHVVQGEIEQVNRNSKFEFYTYILKNPLIDGEKASFGIKFVSYQSESYEDGDIISFQTELNSVSQDKFGVALSSGYALNSNSSKAVEKVGSNFNFFNACKRKIKSLIFERMGNSAGFCYALTIGDVGYINCEEMDNFRYAGIAHVFAVSGLHVGFMATILSFICNLLKFKRLKKFVLVTLITLLYSGICGWTASSLRAVIMYSVYLLSKSFGRKYDVVNGISFSAILVLVINPFDLMSLGFILSFACVLSMTIFSPFFLGKLKFKNKNFNNSLAVSLSVVLGITPIMSFYFGNFSLISIVLNLIVIPLISVQFIVLITTMLISLIIPILQVLLVIPQVFAQTITSVLNYINFEKLVTFASFSVVSMIIYYLLAILICDKVNVSKRIKNISFLSCVGFTILIAI